MKSKNELYNYISDSGVATEADIKDIATKYDFKYMLVMRTTGMVECTAYTQIDDFSRILEARFFDENKELKVIRPTITDDFSWRLIDDEKFREKCTGESFDDIFDNCVLDEDQYLDIDSKKTTSNSEIYTATGGGVYRLPESGLEKTKIRNYICYDENGIANISDFRIVGFVKEGE